MSFLKTHKTKILFITTIIILFLIYRKIDFIEIKKEFSNLNLFWIYLSSIWFFFWPISTTFRFHFFANKCQKVSFKNCFKYNSCAMFYNSVLPSKGGDFLRYIFLKNNHNFSKTDAFSVVLIDKLVDMVSLLFIVLIGFLVSNETIPYYTEILIFIILSIVCVIIFKNLFLKINFIKKNHKIISFLESYHKFSKNGGIYIGLFLAIINNLGNYIQIWFFCLALNINIGFGETLLLISLSVIIGMIPITLNGMGTRDSALLFLFSNIALKSSIVILGIFISLRTVIGGLLGFILAPRYVLFSQKIIKNRE